MGQNSDHPSLNTGGGRDWVASIVNAIGESACRDADGRNYRETTATLIVGRLGRIARSRSTADSASAPGGLSVWFRVPFLFVSAYTPAGLIENSRHDFGSILRFIERNFGASEGVLDFADARAKDALPGFFDFRVVPRPFSEIHTQRSAAFSLTIQLSLRTPTTTEGPADTKKTVPDASAPDNGRQPRSSQSLSGAYYD